LSTSLSELASNNSLFYYTLTVYVHILNIQHRCCSRLPGWVKWALDRALSGVEAWALEVREAAECMGRCSRAECKECSQASKEMLAWACRVTPECKVVWVECLQICKPCFNNNSSSNNKAVLVEMVMVDLPLLPVVVVVGRTLRQVVPWEVREVPVAKAIIPVIEHQRVSSRPPWRLATMRVVDPTVAEVQEVDPMAAVEVQEVDPTAAVEVQEADPTVVEAGIMVEAVAVWKHSLIYTVIRHQVAARVLGSKCQAGRHRNYRI
jgi:hypothetical protein